MTVTTPPGLAAALGRIREIQAQLGTTGESRPSVTAGNSAFARTLSAALGTTGGQQDAAAAAAAGSGTQAALSALTSAFGTGAGSEAVRALLGTTSGTGATTGAELGDRAVDLAKGYSGTPYLWGGTDPDKGLDCSGLTQLVFRRLGVDLPRTSAEQSRVGEKVASLDDARPGDLLFFGSPVHHVGIYAGDGRMVDAPHRGATVGVHKIWTSQLSGIRRVTTDDVAQAGPAAGLQSVASALPALTQLRSLAALDGAGTDGGDAALPGGAAGGSVTDLLEQLTAGPGTTLPGVPSGGIGFPGRVRQPVSGGDVHLPGSRGGGVGGVQAGGSVPVGGNGSGVVTDTWTTTVNALLAAQRGFGPGAPGGVMGSAGEHTVTLNVARAAGTSSAADVSGTAASSAGWRSRPYADLFAAAGAKYDVDPALLSAIARAESGYRAGARSHAGAVGLMQIMPGTARELGVDASDPAQAVDGAARLVARYLKSYDGDVPTVLAAYNAGPGAVRRYGGVPPYAETRTYVSRVTGYWEDLR